MVISLVMATDMGDHGAIMADAAQVDGRLSLTLDDPAIMPLAAVPGFADIPHRSVNRSEVFGCRADLLSPTIVGPKSMFIFTPALLAACATLDPPATLAIPNSAANMTLAPAIRPTYRPRCITISRMLIGPVWPPIETCWSAVAYQHGWSPQCFDGIGTEPRCNLNMEVSRNPPASSPSRYQSGFNVMSKSSMSADVASFADEVAHMGGRCLGWIYATWTYTGSARGAR